MIAVDAFVYDAAGVATTLAADQYQLVSGNTKWPKIIPAYGAAWPAVNWGLKPLVISFRAGFARRTVSPTEGAEKVPEAYKLAMKLIIGHFFTNREAVADMRIADLPKGVEWLLEGERTDLGIA